MNGTAVAAGATGLVGSELLPLLCEASEYGRVIALARRPVALVHPKLAVRAADFERLADVLRDVHGARRPLDVFCSLGTTIAAAGSQAAFRRVDFDYVLALARWAKAAHARRFVVVSALGANAASAAFYNRVKGETEQALRALGLASLVILRPSLLDGERVERRAGERLALLVARPIRTLIPKDRKSVV